MQQQTEQTSFIRTNQLQLYVQTSTLYCDDHIKHMAHCARNMHNFLMLKHVVHIAAIVLHDSYEVWEIHTAQKV